MCVCTVLVQRPSANRVPAVAVGLHVEVRGVVKKIDNNNYVPVEPFVYRDLVVD